jgi:hypothetical protein
MLVKPYSALPSETDMLYANQSKKIKSEEYINVQNETGNPNFTPDL